MELIGQAQGKLLLFGEHAVVHGHPALGMPLPLTTRVSLKITNRPAPTSEQALVKRLIQHWDAKERQAWEAAQWAVTIHSEVPMGLGFGSSAALAAALARAWHNRMRKDMPPATVYTLAHQAEREFHGHPSGVDTTLALGQGLIRFQGQTTTPVSSAAPFWCVTGAVARESTTKTLVSRIHQAVKTSQETRQVMATLGTLAQQACTQLPRCLQPSAQLLGPLAQQAQIRLRQLGLSTTALEEVLARGMDAGANGGKLSGAGSGGAFVLFCASEDRAQAVTKALKQCPHPVTPIWTFASQPH